MFAKIFCQRVRPSSAISPWLVKHSGFCVGRYARGAGGITPFRVAYDRDYTLGIVPFVVILALERRGLSSVTRFHKGDTVWTKGIRSGSSESNPVHLVGTMNGAVGGENNPKIGTDKMFEDVFWYSRYRKKYLESW